MRIDVSPDSQLLGEGDRVMGNETVEPATLAADVVLFGTDAQGVPHVLVVQRGRRPFAGCWALPGGRVDLGETFEQAARRELVEETGVPACHVLMQVGIYDRVDRDPRGRVISVAYLGVVPALITPTAGDDAAAARWVPYVSLVAEPNVLAFDHARIVSDAAELLDQRGWRLP